MPLISTNLLSILGLNTEASIIDISARPPSSMTDCMNIAFNRSGQAVARKGHPHLVTVNWDDTNAFFPYNLGFSSAVDNSQLIIPYYLNAITSNIRVYNNAACTLYTDPGVFAYSKGVVISPTPLGEFTTRSTFTPVTYNQGKTYVGSTEGIYREEAGGGGPIFVQARPNYIHIEPSMTGAATNTFDPEYFFTVGNAVKLRAVVISYLPTGAQVESAVSSTRELRNTAGLSSITVQIRVSSDNILDLTRSYVKIYRTTQYEIGTPPNTAYYEAMAISLDKFTDLGVGLPLYYSAKLVLNDDAIVQFEEIYNSNNADGPLNDNTTIPGCYDLTVYKNYGIFSSAILPTFTTLNVTALPNSGDKLFLVHSTGVSTSFGLEISPTYTANSTTPPGTTGAMAAADYTYKGTGSVNTDLKIVPVAPTGTGSSGVVPYYHSTIGITYGAAVNGVVDVTFPAPSAGFDLSSFESPVGIFAAVNSSGVIKDLVTYSDYSSTAAAGIKFFGCTSLLGNVSTTLAGTFYIYPLKGTSVANLPIYASNNSGTYPGFSLLPTYEQYPASPYLKTPVGVVNSAYNVAGFVKCTPAFFGIYWKAAADLLDDVAKDIVNQFNLQRFTQNKPYLPYLRYDGIPGQFTMITPRVQNPNVTPATRGIGFYSYRGTTGAPTKVGLGIQFDQPLPLPFVNTTSLYDQDLSTNILVLSKSNRIENIPFSQILAPVKVGLDTQRLQRVAVNNDQLYCFKENEGIYRVELVPGLNVPQVAAISVVDNTTWLTGDQTVQEIGESVYFLSNRGVVQLNNGQLTIVSRNIESELKNIVASETLANIRSFGNNLRRQYGIYFPTLNKTYVLDLVTGEWSKWSFPFNQSISYPDGRLATLENLVGLNFQNLPSTRYFLNLRRDVYSAGQGWDATSDQYDTIASVFSVSQNGNIIDFSIPTVTSGDDYLRNVANLAKQYNLTTTKCYYRNQAGALFPMTFVNRDLSTLRFTFDASIPTAVAGGTGQSAIVIGVQASVTFNRFFTSPNSLMQFTECQIQAVGSYTLPSIGFEADTATPTFPAANFVTIPTTYDIIRVQVPRNQARGRWCQVRVEHTYPFERFTLAGLAWVYRDQNTFKVKVRSNP